ncbi:MAG: hypothetical protein MPJ24_04940 [Pirellulaceae bacterium]|nr:hypothetical protein [Pirellulaceae bacterium]
MSIDFFRLIFNWEIGIFWFIIIAPLLAGTVFTFWDTCLQKPKKAESTISDWKQFSEAIVRRNGVFFLSNIIAFAWKYWCRNGIFFLSNVIAFVWGYWYGANILTVL